MQKKTIKSQNMDSALTKYWPHLKPVCALTPNQPCRYQVVYIYFIYIVTAPIVAQTFFFFFFLKGNESSLPLRLHVKPCLGLTTADYDDLLFTWTAAQTFDVAQIFTGTITAIKAPASTAELQRFPVTFHEF